MMSEFPFMPLWTGDYLKDTRHLTTRQHGAYILLLMEAWERPSCRLPDDDVLLARLTCSTLRVWAADKPVVMAFWKLDGRSKEWTQKRLIKERAFVASKKAKQSDRSRSGWEKRKNREAAAMYPHPHPHPRALTRDAPPLKLIEGSEV